MKKNNLYYIIFSIVIVLVTLASTLLIKSCINNGDNYNIDKMTVEIDENSKLVISNNKLYDEYDNKFVTTSIDDYFNEYEFKLIEIYEKNNYYFLIYSTDQTDLFNDMFLDVMTLNNNLDNTIAFIVSKNNGNGCMFHFKNYSSSCRYDMSAIEFVSNQVFIIPQYDMTSYNPVNIIKVTLNNNDNLAMSSYNMVYDNMLNYNPQIINYAHTTDLFICTYEDENGDLCTIIEKIISSSLTSNLISKYKDEVNVMNGNYYEIDNKVYYINESGEEMFIE